MVSFALQRLHQRQPRGHRGGRERGDDAGRRDRDEDSADDGDGQAAALPGYRRLHRNERRRGAEHDAGLVVIDPAERLRGYQAVENTYLSTFQALGALGLVLGTLGLGAVVVRNILERRREMALLAAVGYGRNNLRLLVAGEVGLIVAAGVVLGAAAALIAVQPAIARQGGGLPVTVIGGVLVAVAASGIVATLAATAVAARLPLVESLKSE